MTPIQKRILSIVSDRKMSYIVIVNIASELNMTFEDVEEQFKLMQDDGFVEYERRTWDSAEVRITADGYRALNDEAEDI